MNSRSFALFATYLAMATKLVSASGITTANCNFVKDEYKTELSLIYSYIAEFSANTSESLSGLEMVTAHAVAQSLDECDKINRPLYKVKTSEKHLFSKTETCTPSVDGSSCHVVTGITPILLDYYSSHAKDMAYDAIQGAFANPELMQLLAPTVLKAEFLEPLNEVLLEIENDDDSNAPGSVTMTVAVFACAIAFLVASIICYGLMRESNNKKTYSRRRNGISSTFNPRTPYLRGKNHIKPQRSFVRLEDGVSSCDSVVETNVPDSETYVPSIERFNFQTSQNYEASITWSVSDITSDDSGSIRSNLSRATSSKLERIEEGEEDEEPRKKDKAQRRKRNVRDFDCVQFMKGALYVSELSSLLVMPGLDGDLELGMVSSVVSNDPDSHVPVQIPRTPSMHLDKEKNAAESSSHENKVEENGVEIRYQESLMGDTNTNDEETETSSLSGLEDLDLKGSEVEDDGSEAIDEDLPVENGIEMDFDVFYDAKEGKGSLQEPEDFETEDDIHSTESEAQKDNELEERGNDKVDEKVSEMHRDTHEEGESAGSVQSESASSSIDSFQTIDENVDIDFQHSTSSSGETAEANLDANETLDECPTSPKVKVRTTQFNLGEVLTDKTNCP